MLDSELGVFDFGLSLSPSLLGAGLDVFFQHLRGLGASFRVMAQFLGGANQVSAKKTHLKAASSTIETGRLRIDRVLAHYAVKEECLSKLILFGEKSLRHALREYVVHHHERNHQGKENLLLFPASEELHQSEGKVRSRERLGGLLRFYHREAA